MKSNKKCNVRLFFQGKKHVLPNVMRICSTVNLYWCNANWFYSALIRQNRCAIVNKKRKKKEHVTQREIVCFYATYFGFELKMYTRFADPKQSHWNLYTCVCSLIIVLVSWNAAKYNNLLIYIWIEPQWVVGHNARNCKFIDNICAHAYANDSFFSLVNPKCWFNDVKWHNDNNKNEISYDLYGIQVAALEKRASHMGSIQLANQLSRGAYKDRKHTPHRILFVCVEINFKWKCITGIFSLDFWIYFHDDSVDEQVLSEWIFSNYDDKTSITRRS